MELDARGLLDIIPHRYPFLLVDRIIDLVPGQRATGIKQVSASDPWFQGHFPGHPVMPGVLIVEALAQVGAVALLSLDDHRGNLGLLAGLDKARFRQPVVPGDTLMLECHLERIRRGVGVARGVASVGQEEVASAKITFALSPMPEA